MEPVHSGRHPVHLRQRIRRHPVPDLRGAPSDHAGRRRAHLGVRAAPLPGGHLHLWLSARLGTGVHSVADRWRGVHAGGAGRVARFARPRREDVRERPHTAHAVDDPPRHSRRKDLGLRSDRDHHRAHGAQPTLSAHVLHGRDVDRVRAVPGTTQGGGRARSRRRPPTRAVRRGRGRAGHGDRGDPVHSVLPVHRVLTESRGRARLGVRHGLLHAARGIHQHLPPAVFGNRRSLLGPQRPQAPLRVPGRLSAHPRGRRIRLHAAEELHLVLGGNHHLGGARCARWLHAVLPALVPAPHDEQGARARHDLLHRVARRRGARRDRHRTAADRAVAQALFDGVGDRRRRHRAPCIGRILQRACARNRRAGPRSADRRECSRGRAWRMAIAPVRRRRGGRALAPRHAQAGPARHGRAAGGPGRDRPLEHRPALLALLPARARALRARRSGAVHPAPAGARPNHCAVAPLGHGPVPVGAERAGRRRRAHDVRHPHGHGPPG